MSDTASAPPVRLSVRGARSEARVSSPKLTVWEIAEGVDRATVTTAEVRALVEQVKALLRASAAAQPPGVARYLRENAVGLASLVVAILVLAIAYRAAEQDRAEYAKVDAPPSVTVVVPPPDPAEVDRLVDERLRERGLLPPSE